MSIKPSGIFEVHFAVKNRKTSTKFYERIFGFQLATHIDRRDITFLWMNGTDNGMVGLWGPDCPDPPISRGRTHVAFQASPEQVEAAPSQLRNLGVTPLDFDGNETGEAIVLCWMPAISVYFQDPDGNSLEYISMLNEKPEPDMGVMKLSEWRNRKTAK